MTAATWIIGTLVKATLLLVAGGGAATVLRRGSAAWRHLAWGTAVAGLFVLPLASLGLPRLAVLPVPGRTVVEIPQVSAARGDRAADVVSGTAGDASISNTAPDIRSGIVAAPSSPFHVNWWLVFLAVWALGATVLLGRLVLGAWLLHRVVRRATPLAVPAWRRQLLEGADRLALARLPALVESDRLPMPFACGLLRPAIVLPTAASGWSDRRRQAVLYHELAHLSRYDILVNVLGQVACALYWFHPLVWVAARKLRVESERACDDLVLSVGTRPSEYADHLLQIVCRAARAHTPAVALPMAQRREFEGRMLAILERAARRDPTSGRHAAGVGALALALVLPLAALAPAGARAARPAVGVPNTLPIAAASAASSTDTTATEAARRRPAPDTSVAPRAPAAPAAAIDSNTVVLALIEALQDSVADVREDAAYALGRMAAGTAAAPLGQRLIRDPAPEVREMAAWALGRIGNGGRAEWKPLGAAVVHDSTETVRTMAVWALGRLGDTAATTVLSAVLRDPVGEVRARAAWALGTIAPPTAPPALQAALHDPLPDVRLRAAWALGRIEDSAAAPALAAVLRDSSATVRRAVLWALGRVGGDAAQRALMQAVQDPDPEVRDHAIRALAGSHGDPWPWPWPMPIIR